MWAQRALAYYYALEGRPGDSYEALRKCLAEASRLGLKKPHYALPWFLNCCLNTIREDMTRSPDYDFHKEMQTALNGINLHLRGTAFRILAKQTVADTCDRNVNKIENLLEKA